MPYTLAGQILPHARAQRQAPCRRCNGPTYIESDSYGRYIACLDCGAHTDVGPDGKPLRPLPLANDNHTTWLMRAKHNAEES